MQEDQTSAPLQLDLAQPPLGVVEVTHISSLGEVRDQGEICMRIRGAGGLKMAVDLTCVEWRPAAEASLAAGPFCCVRDSLLDGVLAVGDAADGAVDAHSTPSPVALSGAPAQNGGASLGRQPSCAPRVAAAAAPLTPQPGSRGGAAQHEGAGHMAAGGIKHEAAGTPTGGAPAARRLSVGAHLASANCRTNCRALLCKLTVHAHRADAATSRCTACNDRQSLVVRDAEHDARAPRIVLACRAVHNPTGRARCR